MSHMEAVQKLIALADACRTTSLHFEDVRRKPQGTQGRHVIGDAHRARNFARRELVAFAGATDLQAILAPPAEKQLAEGGEK